MQSAKQVIEETIRIVNEEMSAKLVGAEYLSKIEFTGKQFPKLFIFMANASTIQQFSDNVTLTLSFVDVVVTTKDQQRYDYEIKSDMIQIASELIHRLRLAEVLTSTDDITYNPNYAFGGDGLSGIVLDVTFPLDKTC